jgi:hypothetical protein
MTLQAAELDALWDHLWGLEDRINVSVRRAPSVSSPIGRDRPRYFVAAGVRDPSAA